MNLLLANSFTVFFKNLFSNWELVLFVILTILLLLMIFFKRFKLLFTVLLILVFAVGIPLVISLIISASKWDIYGLIGFAVSWGPTILFSLIVVLSTLINAKRGRRKSLILLLQSVLSAVLWVLIYYFVVKSTKIDALLVRFVNLFMGKNGLQNALGVPAEATTFRSIFTLYLESLGGTGFVGTLIGDMSAYVYTIADMIYHVIFACVCYLLHLLTVFILYIVYLCFYSERKYRKKKRLAFSENKTTPYKKHHVGGGLVGLVRGILTGVICVSLIGGGLFMVAGRGDGKLKDQEMSGKYESELNLYRAIESYGTQGIFMILNALSDPSDAPYYLFAADLVFSGELDDEFNGVSERVSLRENLGALSTLARDTVTLLVKYGSDEINGALNGTGETGLMQSVLDVMKNKGFQNEFDILISEYDSPTYVHNFCMSLISSVLANLDSAGIGGSLSETNKELLKILFKKGYLSSHIPEDYALYLNNELAKPEDAGEDWDSWSTTGRSVRPYLSLQQLVGKEDVRRFMQIFFTILTSKSEGEDMFETVRSIVPEIKELSLFENGRNQSLDPVLARVYCYFLNTTLKAKGAKDYSYNALVGENVSWVGELNSLLDVAEDFFTIYDHVKDAETAVFNRILYIFNKDNGSRENDVILYDKIVETVSSSRILGKALASSFFTETLTEGLGGLFGDFHIPDTTVYENTFNKDGSVKEYGELYYFLKGLKNIGDREDQTLFELIFGGEAETDDVLSTVAKVMEAADGEGKKFSYYAARSDLFRSVITCFLSESAGNLIYIPDSACDVFQVAQFDDDGKETGKSTYRIIVGEELESVLNGMSTISAFLDDCGDGGDGYYEHIDKFLDPESDMMRLIDKSRIAEGSLARIIRDELCENDSFAGDEETQGIIVPQYLSDDLEKWCTPKSGGSGEIKRFIASYLAVRDKAGRYDGENGEEGDYKLSLKTMMDDDNEEAQAILLTAVAKLGGEGEEEKTKAIETFFASDIIYYTVSDYLQSSILLNGLTVVVPLSARNMLYQDVLKSVVKKEELYLLFSRIDRLHIFDDDSEEGSEDGENVQSATDLLKKLVTNRDIIKGDLLSASVAANMASTKSFNNALHLDAITVSGNSTMTFAEAGDIAYLIQGHYPQNPWYNELPNLLLGLEALFQGEMDDDSFEFSESTLLARMQNADAETLKICYDSRILTQFFLSAAVRPEE